MVVDSGVDQQVMLPVSGSVTVNLSGFVALNLDGVITETTDPTLWIDPSGSGTFGDENARQTTATFTSEGEYKLALVAKDSSGDVIGADTVTIKVHPFDNQQMFVGAAANQQTIELLVDDYIDLDGTLKSGFFDSVNWWVNGGGADWVRFGEPTIPDTTAAFDRPGSYTLVLDTKLEGTVMGWDTVNITVNPAEVFVDARANGVDNVAVIFIDCGIFLTLSGEVFGADTSDLTYEWKVIDGLSEAVTLDHQVSTSPTATVTIDEAGKYELELVAKLESSDVGRDTVRIVLLSSNPIVAAGIDYPTVAPGDTLELNKAQAWYLPTRTLSTIEWTSTPNPGVQWIPAADQINPKVKFLNEGLYTLTLSVTDSQGLSGSDTVDILVESPSVYAGSPKSTIPYYSVPFDDVVVNPSSSGLSYQWAVISDNAADVDFGTLGSNVKNPTVIFYSEGEYTLKLVVLDGSNWIGEGTVTVTVHSDPRTDEGDPPVLGLIGVTDGETLCDEISITVTARDENLRLLYLLLDGIKLEPDSFVINEGTVDNPRDVVLGYTLDTHTISGGPHTLTAYARDVKYQEQRQVSFTNNCTITNYKVNPEVATSTDYKLTFSADFTSSLAWNMYIYKVDETPPATPFASGTGPESLPSEVDFRGWDDGSYKAKLQAGGEVAFVYFDVAISLNTNDLLAEFDSSLKITYDEFGVPEDPRPTVKTITEGFFNGLKGKAFHPHFPDDVYFKIELSDGKGLNKNLTPGYLDDGGFVNATVGSTDESGSFGTVDFSSLANGIYQLKLTVQCQNLVKTDELEVALDCPLKIGNVKFSQEDMVIPLIGYPLRVVRTYDSLNKDRDGDFGHGWIYNLASMDIELNESRVAAGPAGSSFTQRSGDAFGRDVTLTLPDGRRVTFASYMVGSAKYGIGSWTVRYNAPEGVNATLTTKSTETVMCQQLGWGLGWWWDGYVPNDRDFDVDLSLHDFSGWTLKMEDGTIYNIERVSYGKKRVPDPKGEWPYAYEYEPYGKPYLASIETPSGEKIVFKVDTSDPENPLVTEVRHYLVGTNPGNDPLDLGFTKELRIVRDSDNHIKEILAPGDDPAFPSLKYDYDCGNLTKVSKLVFESESDDPEWTRYVYEDYAHGPDDHFITDIEDKRGLCPVRYVYDDSGCLIAVYDAKKNYIKIDHDTFGEFKTETVVNRVGNVTIYYYDERGRVIKEEKVRAGNPNIITEYTYDEYTRYEGTSEQHTYTNDYPDNPCVVTDPLGKKTYYQYDEDGRTKAVIDPELNVTQNVYDESGNGNLLETSQWRPNVGVSRPLFPTDYTEVSTTTNTYTTNNLLKTTEVSEGGIKYDMTVNLYDTMNRLEHVIEVNVPEVIDFGPVYGLSSISGLSSIPGDHIVTTYDYSHANSGSYDQPYRVSDPFYPKDLSGGVGGTIDNPFEEVFTRYSQYDENNSQTMSWYEWEDPSDGDTILDHTVYTHTVYDKQGRVIRTSRQIDSDPAVILSETAYNSIGKVNFTIDQYNNVTKYEYDQTGNLVETRTFSTIAYDIGLNNSGQFVKYIYDPSPPETVTEQPYADFASFEADVDTSHLTTTRTLYDPEGRAVISVGPYDYDRANRAIDPELPVGTETVYDDVGRVEKTNRWDSVHITLQDIENSDGEVVGKSGIGWTTDGVQSVAGNELSYTRTVYDDAGRVFQSIVLDESGTEQMTEYGYDDAGKQTSITDPLSNITTTDYLGTRRWKVTDARNNTTSFEYDALGRLIKTKHPQAEYYNEYKSPTPDYETENTYTHVGYDGLGRKARQSNQVPNQFDTAASVPDDEVRNFGYDAAGRLKTVILPEPDDTVTEPPRYDYFYDDYGNLAAIWDPLQRLSVFTYNEFNKQARRYMPFVHTGALSSAADVYLIDLTGISYEERWYDDLGRLEKLKDFKGQYTVYEYNTASCACGQPGLLKAKKYYTSDPGSTPPPADSEITYTYDNLGRKLTGTIVDTTGTPTYQRCYAYLYDIEGRIETTEIYPTYQDYLDGTNLIDSVGYGYDLTTGRRDVVCTPAAEELTGADTWVNYAYDELGRLKEAEVDKRNGTEPNPDEIATYDYTSVGSRAGLTYANSNYTHYWYNALNRLTKLTNFEQYEADPDVPIGGTLSSFSYTHYADGMRRTLNENMGETRQITYAYDNLNRLKTETGISGVDNYEAKYWYDVVGNRTRRLVTVTHDAAEQKLYTLYEYSDTVPTPAGAYVNPDWLLIETQDNQPLWAFYLGDRPVYAYADGGHISHYRIAGYDRDIGHFRAFWLGLPSRWGPYGLRTALVLLPVMFLIPVLALLIGRSRKRVAQKPRLSLFYRCLSVLLAYMMLMSPVCLQQLAEADIQYASLDVSTWGSDDTVIEYGEWNGDYTVFTPGYDANGSLIKKIKWDTQGSADHDLWDQLEEVTYEYNLQNRLAKVTVDDGSTVITEYKYDPSGNRVEKDVDGTVTDYLIDSYNHTGYAQVFKEQVDDGIDITTTTYVIGDDVLAQASSVNIHLPPPWATHDDPQYLLYDGHGSTRQLTSDPDPVSSNAITINEAYSYDAYGVMLGGNPGSPQNPGSPATRLLCAGEQFDTNLQMYYNRARYYDQNTGRFNRMDPFAGNRHDPQSLHKYTYCHNNPVNAVDPSGRFTLLELSLTLSVLCLFGAIIYSVHSGITRRNTSPKHITICISVSTRGKPDTWDTLEIEQRLDAMFKPVWERLEVGQSVDIELIEERYPPGQLGWTEISETERLYNGRIAFQKPIISVLLRHAFAYTPIYMTTVSTHGTVNYMQAYTYLDDVIWPVWWTNVIAHEQLYLGAGKNWDNLIAERYDLGSDHPSVDEPAVLSDRAIENMLEGFELSVR